MKQKIMESYNDLQISQYVQNVLNWYNAFFIQTKRLIDTQEKARNAEYNAVELIPEQIEAFYWVTALHHAVNGLQNLRTMLDKQNNNILDRICDCLCDPNFIEKVNACRNSNEHFEEYLCGQGHKMDIFECDLQFNENIKIRSNQHWIVIYENKWFIGGLNVAETVKLMKECKDEINSILENVIDEYWMKGVKTNG